MTDQIQLPNLPPERVAEIEAARVEGKSIGEISRLFNIPYTTVYFYAVNGGKPAPPEARNIEPCWCGRPHRAKGLCSRHYEQMRYHVRAALRAEAA